MQIMQELQRIQEMQEIHRSILQKGVHYLHERLDRIQKETDKKNTLPVFQEHYTVMFKNRYTAKALKAMHLRDYSNLERRCIISISPRHYYCDGSSRQEIIIDILAPSDMNYDYTEVSFWLSSESLDLNTPESTHHMYGIKR